VTDVQAITITITQQAITVSPVAAPAESSGISQAQADARYVRLVQTNPFTFIQSAPAAIWTINHNLGYRPQVTLLDTGNSEFNADVVHPSVNQTVVTMASALPMAGSARLQ